MGVLNTLYLASLIVGGIAAAIALVTSRRGWWETPERRKERERDEAVRDAILGAAEVRDESGGIINPAEPGLVQRTITLESAVKTIAQGIASNADLHAEFAALRRDHGARLGEHDAAIASLIASTFERGAETSLKAVKLKNADAIDGNPEP